MLTLRPDDPLAVATCQAIQSGDREGLPRLLAEHPELATAAIAAP